MRERDEKQFMCTRSDSVCGRIKIFVQGEMMRVRLKFNVFLMFVYLSLGVIVSWRSTRFDHFSSTLRWFYCEKY